MPASICWDRIDRYGSLRIATNRNTNKSAGYQQTKPDKNIEFSEDFQQVSELLGCLETGTWCPGLESNQ